MKQKEFMDALVQAKRIGNLLDDVYDLSMQLSDAVNRGDRVSIQMIITMREEPVSKLKLADTALRDRISALSKTDPETAKRLAVIMDGGKAGASDEEPLAKQVAINRRQLVKVLELDRMLNKKIAREKSIYID